MYEDQKRIPEDDLLSSGEYRHATPPHHHDRLSYYSPRGSESYDIHREIGYSPEFVSKLEYQHEKNLKSAYERLRLEAQNHEKVVDALKNQVLSLRQQLELSSKAAQAELSKQRERIEARYGKELQEKEEALSYASSKVEDLQRMLDTERDKSKTFREETLDLKMKYAQNMEQMQEQLRTSHTPESTLPADQLVLQQRVEFQNILSDLQTQIHERDQFISQMKRDTEGFRTSSYSRREAQEKDILILQETVDSSKKLISLQEQEIAKLKQVREETKREAVEAYKEANLREMETTRLKAKNEQLQARVDKIEQLLYGDKKEHGATGGIS